MARVREVRNAASSLERAHPALLDKLILAAFKRAVADDRDDVADPLLRALEILAREPQRSSALRDAFTAIAGNTVRPGGRKQPH